MQGSPRARALNESWVRKIRNFQPISRRISETVQDRTKVTIRKSHTPFRLVPKSTTLDDLSLKGRTHPVVEKMRLSEPTITKFE